MQWIVAWLAALGLLSCATPPVPLRAGPILSVSGRASVARGALVEELRSARFAVLGEAHDNPLHHELQALLLRQLTGNGGAPAVVFEMLRVDQQPAIDEVVSGPPPRLDALRAAVGWDESGWPPWELYAPVFEAALDAGLPIRAGDLSREELALLRKGEAPEGLVAELGLAEPLAPELEASLARDLEVAHCSPPPEHVLRLMIQIQRARDARLAHSMLGAAGETGSAVLIAGAEHARLDRGAPRALSRLAPAATVVSVAFLELAPVAPDPWPVLEERYVGPPPFDFVWLTTPAPRKDPCAR